MNEGTLWIGFNFFVLLMLVLDLGVFHRKSSVISVKEALIWTCVWILLAFLFNVFVFYQLGEEKAFEFFTGYIIEKSLSVDNIFVIILIFSFFNVPAAYQHKVFFWGILGALVMRGVMIVGVKNIVGFSLHTQDVAAFADTTLPRCEQALQTFALTLRR